MMRRLKSITSGRSSVSDPVIFFPYVFLFVFMIFFCVCFGQLTQLNGHKRGRKMK